MHADWLDYRLGFETHQTDRKICRLHNSARLVRTCVRVRVFTRYTHAHARRRATRAQLVRAALRHQHEKKKKRNTLSEHRVGAIHLFLSFLCCRVPFSNDSHAISYEIVIWIFDAWCFSAPRFPLFRVSSSFVSIDTAWKLCSPELSVPVAEVSRSTHWLPICGSSIFWRVAAVIFNAEIFSTRLFHRAAFVTSAF